MKYIALIIIPLLALRGLGQTRAANPYKFPDGLYSEITTQAGVVVCELYYKQTPMTCANYVGLAEGTLGPRRGQNFYNGLAWHRVISHFVIQGGDGGRLGYEFPDEIVPGLRHDSIGVLQMANDGPDTNGSQFCLMTNPENRLNYNHTVFGHVVRGLEVLANIKQGDTMQVKILRLGDDAKAFKADQEAFDTLVKNAKRYGDLPRTPGPEAFFDDPDKILPTNPARASDFNHKLANFQRFTGGRIIGRVYAKAPADAQGDKLEAWLAALAQKMKVNDSGALAVYFAGSDQWHIRIGKESVADFLAGPRKPDGTKTRSAPPGGLDDGIASFLADMHKEVPGLIDISLAATAPPNNTLESLTAGQKMKFQVDSVLDNLIFRLEPPAIRIPAVPKIE